MSQAAIKMETSRRRRGGDGRVAPLTADLWSASDTRARQHAATDSCHKVAARRTGGSRQRGEGCPK